VAEAGKLRSASASKPSPARACRIDHRRGRSDDDGMPTIEESIAATKPTGTAEYTLSTICLDGEHPLKFHLQYAGRGNGPFWSASIKRMNEQRRQSGGKVTNARIEENLDAEAVLFAKYVIVGWEHAYEDGKALACTPDNVLRVLRALIENRSDIFLMLTEFARDAENFRDVGIAAGPELGKG
jgi:hypothetical protein